VNIIEATETSKYKDYSMAWSFYHFALGYAFLIASIVTNLMDCDRKKPAVRPLLIFSKPLSPIVED